MPSLCNCVSYPDQPVTDVPLGPYVARGPVGSFGMHSLCDSDQLVADGPVGPYVPEPLEHLVLGFSVHPLVHLGADRLVSPITNPVGPVGPITNTVGLVGPYVARGPVGSYGMLSPCDSDQLVADGPVCPFVPDSVGSYGTCPRVTLTLMRISLRLLAQWACVLHVARWARMGCYPHVTLARC